MENYLSLYEQICILIKFFNRLKLFDLEMNGKDKQLLNDFKVQFLMVI